MAKSELRKWTVDEDKILLNMDASTEEIGALIGRTPAACYTRKVTLRRKNKPVQMQVIKPATKSNVYHINGTRLVIPFMLKSLEVTPQGLNISY